MICAGEPNEKASIPRILVFANLAERIERLKSVGADTSEL